VFPEHLPLIYWWNAQVKQQHYRQQIHQARKQL
jgi:hypothetical protein